MPTVEVDLPALHATQRQVVAEAKRFNALCCGRRWGKTLLATTRLAQVALQGYPVGLFSPTYRVLGRHVQGACRRLGAGHRPGVSTREADRAQRRGLGRMLVTGR